MCTLWHRMGILCAMLLRVLSSYKYLCSTSLVHFGYAYPCGLHVINLCSIQFHHLPLPPQSKFQPIRFLCKGRSQFLSDLFTCITATTWGGGPNPGPTAIKILG